MSTIQQAAKRLEELRRAGVAIPWDSAEDATKLEGAGGAGGATGNMPLERTPLQLPDAPSQVEIEEALAKAPSPLGIPKSVARHSEFARLDLLRLAQDGYLVPGHSNMQLGEEFRVIKRPLIRNAQGKSAAPIRHANLIVVTSALAGEGKTFVSTNLAMSLAMELDTSALLVEADILRPTVMARLGLQPRRGLLDILTDTKLELADVLLRTNINKLSLLPAGSRSMQTTELLASTRMGEFLDELAARYSDRIVVFDAPPLLLTSEARVLASRVGQVVVVVEAGRTPTSALAQAMATIEACPVVMTVLNKTKKPHAGMVYGYGNENMVAAMASSDSDMQDDHKAQEIP
jgi:protein-tyrosine kinase